MISSEENIQFKNVGNMGDIIKHGALVNLLQLSLQKAAATQQNGGGRLLHVDTHTFLMRAPFPGRDSWTKNMENLNQQTQGAYEAYMQLQTTESEFPQQYLCSSGMALKLIKQQQSAVSAAASVLSERHAETRAKLTQQLQDAGHGSIVKHIMHHSTEMCASDGDMPNLDAWLTADQESQKTAAPLNLFALVDPFELEQTEWHAIQQGLVNKLASRGQTSCASAIMLVFTYDATAVKSSAEVWRDFRADERLFSANKGNPIAVIRYNKYHLAVYSSLSIQDDAKHCLQQLGWQLLSC